MQCSGRSLGRKRKKGQSRVNVETVAHSILVSNRYTASAAKREMRVGARGTSWSHASVRRRLSATGDDDLLQMCSCEATVATMSEVADADALCEGPFDPGTARIHFLICWRLLAQSGRV